MKRPQGEEVQVRILLNLLNMTSRDAQFIGFMRYWHHVIYTEQFFIGFNTLHSTH